MNIIHSKSFYQMGMLMAILGSVSPMFSSAASCNPNKGRTLKIMKSRVDPGKFWCTSPDFTGSMEEIEDLAARHGYEGVEMLVKE